MSPEELAERHPYLYHITEPGAAESICQKGLLSTSKILDLYEIQSPLREQLEAKRRPTSVALEHPYHGALVLNDNQPLTELALQKCLDDDLTPPDWLRILNKRVFFWPDEDNLQRHLNARFNRQRTREVIVIDTLRMAQEHAHGMELCAINSGATIRKAARRGLKTFTPLLQYSWVEWQKLRGLKDRIREITVLDGVPNLSEYILNIYQIKGTD